MLPLCWAHSEGFNELMDLRTTFTRARVLEWPSAVPQSIPVLGRARARESCAQIRELIKSL